MDVKEFIQKLENLNCSLKLENGKLILQASENALAEEIDSIRKNEEIVGFIRSHKSRLIEYLSLQGTPSETMPDSNVSGIYRLSGTQEGMLFHTLYDQGGSAYVNQFTCDLLNPVVDAIKSSWAFVLKKHSILRSGFYHNDFKIPVQCVFDTVSVPIEVTDLRRIDSTELEASAESYRQQDRSTPFDLTKPPLMRIRLLRMNESTYQMIWTFHHIIMDGWSLPVLMKEFLESYELSLNGKLLPPQHEDRYEDYIRYTESLDKEKQETFWKKYLQDFDRSTLLPFIASSATRNRGIGEYREEAVTIEHEMVYKTQEYAKRHRLTINTIMQGVWAYLLHHYMDNDHVCFGVTVSGRAENLPDIEQRVGIYTNTLPLHSFFQPGNAVVDWLQAMQAGQFSAREHQYAHLSEIQEWTSIRGDFFDSLFVFENYPFNTVIAARDWKLKVKNVRSSRQTNYPLTIIFVAEDEKMQVSLSYNSELLTSFYINQIKDHFIHVWQQMIESYEAMLGDIRVLPPEETDTVLKSFNNTKAGYPQKTMIDLFHEQVERTPDAIAIVFDTVSLTYQQLNEKCNQVGHYLQRLGIKEDMLVPVCLERTEKMIIAMIGILKAGAAYVPIDPDYPAERIGFMIADTGGNVVITNSDIAERVGISDSVLAIDLFKDLKILSELPTYNVKTFLQPSHAAYVIYTSGSTGHPKGVVVDHSNVVRLFETDSPIYDFNARDVWTVFHSFCFDFSVWEMYGALFYGGRLIIVPKAVTKDTAMFGDLLVSHNVTVLNQTPSSFYVLQDYLVGKDHRIRYVIFGGEALDPSKLDRWKHTYGQCKLINMYGITETTVHVTYQEIDGRHLSSRTSIIGKPIPTLRAYVIDRNFNIASIGTPGELYVGGAGVSRGYLNLPELTGEKFLADPFNKDSGARMYKTGDLGRWLPDGTLEYLGRIDEQVKIRGYRIELGEIESVLHQSGMVTQGVVIARAGTDGNKWLVAYLVSPMPIDKEKLTSFLRSKLPEYMIPSAFVELESIPLTPNGKVDRKTLLAIEPGSTIQAAYEPPANDLESLLVDIWQQVLRVDRIGVFDNFFELGGHSLLATRVISQVRKRTNAELKIKELFEYPTVRELARRLGQGSDTQPLALPVIEKKSRPSRIPLSFSQERLWFIDQLTGSSAYHMSSVLRLKGALQVDALNYALESIVNRHEVLRTVIDQEDGQAYQRVLEEGNWRLHLQDVPAHENGEWVSKEVTRLISIPFDLAQDHNLRAHLLLLGHEDHLLVVTQHHIASDGWSIPIMINELTELYNSKVEGRPCQLNSLSLQYADYAIWQRGYLSGEVLEKKLSYWNNKLSGVLPLNIPTDHIRTSEPGHHAGRVLFQINNELSRQINALSLSRGVTQFMTLLSAFTVLLSRYSGQEDICIGSPVANRGQEEIAGMIGFFVNMLALRTDLSGSPTFIQLLDRIKITTLEAYEHQDVPFEKVVESTVKERDMSRSPLFQILFTVDKHDQKIIDRQRLTGVTIIPEDTEQSSTKFDITLTITESANQLEGRIDYNKELFDQETIIRMSRHYVRLITAIVEQPTLPVDQFPLLTTEEEQLLTIAFNKSQRNYRHDATVIDLFEESVKRYTGNIAVLFESTALTYKELDERSNQLAHYLKKAGVKEQSLVPICVERNVEMIVGIMGILKAGAAYVPIDPLYPGERINHMLDDSRADVIVSSAAGNSFQTKKGARVIEIDNEWQAISHESKATLQVQRSPDHLFYVIYTSGSTGKPKGTGVFHRGVVNLLQWYIREFSINEHDRNIIVTSLGFDLMQKNIFGTLLSGGAVVLPNMELYDIAVVKRCIANHSVTIINCATSAFTPLVDQASSFADIKTLRLAIIGAEPTRIKSFARWIASDDFHCEIVNTYGPAEATDIASFYRLGDPTKYLETVVPIGKSNDNVQLYILNNKNQLQPLGVTGEICIAGDGIGLGYWSDPDLTAKKFPDNPFGAGRMYKTGDLGCWRPDGNMLFVGRADDQIKIRGYRIELGEIETVLNKSHLVKQAVVTTKVLSGEHTIVCYYIADSQFVRHEVNSYLKGKLPEYMIPPIFVEVQQFPFTPNGKIDRKALPVPDIDAIMAKDYAPPRGTFESAIVGIWQSLLNVNPVGIDHNFFALGGHSLLAMRTVAAMHASLQVAVTIRDLFNHPTIRELSSHLRGGQYRKAISTVIGIQEKPSRIPLSYSQERLWFMDQLDGSIEYHSPTLLRLKGGVNINALQTSLENIINRHDILRTVIKHENGKPYQHVLEKGAWQIKLIDGTQYQPDSDALKSDIDQLIATPFDLSCDHMLRATLITLGKNDYLLVLVVHHIATDGWSWPIIIKELGEFYGAQVEARTPALPELSIQYADYSIWQRKQLTTEVLDRKLSYWKEKLAGVEQLNLATDYPRSDAQRRNGRTIQFEIGRELTGNLKNLSYLQGATLFMTLLGGFKVLLYRYTGQTDICVGNSIANRGQQEIEGLVGFFLNALALRSDLSGNPAFCELLQSVKETTLDAFEHQDVPFSKVVEVVVKERDMFTTPLFQILFELQNNPKLTSSIENSFSGIELSQETFGHTTAKFDITFTISEYQDHLLGIVEYCSDLYHEQTIRSMVSHYLQLLDVIARTPEIKIDSIDIVTAREKQKLLLDFNDTASEYPRDKTISDIFEEQSKSRPDAPAVVANGKQVTFGRLNALVNTVALTLTEYEIKQDGIVAILADRSIEMMIAILGVWKAGGAILLIDPELPEERIRFMLVECNSTHLLSDEKGLRGRSFPGIEIIDMSRFAQGKGTPENPPKRSRSRDLSYVIFTSGSTGTPKGVMVEHQSKLNHIYAFIRSMEIDSASVIAQTAPASFDILLWQMVTGLIVGGKTVIYSKELQLNVEEFVHQLIRDKVTVLEVVPVYLASMLEILAESRTSFVHMKCLVSTGEELKRNLVAKWFNVCGNIPLFNVYGPTEASDDVTLYRLDNPIDATHVPIGKPIQNTKIYIVNESMQLCPVGVPGQIAVGGECLSRGYINTALNTKRFINSPFADVEKLYLTGDVGKWLPDGNIVFMGRDDSQVKIRGHRIELGEIERALLKLPYVKETVVIVAQEEGGAKQLVAYIVADNTIVAGELRRSLEQTLPAYMIPPYFIQLPKLPITNNGKVDRKALPKHQLKEQSQERSHKPPRTEDEIKLVEIWEGVLGKKGIGVTDNFFEIGGDSIMSIQIVSHMKRAGYSVIPKDIFLQHTIAQLLKVVSERSKNKLANTDRQAPLTGKSGLLPIQQWYLEKDISNRSHFNQSVFVGITKDVSDDRLRQIAQQIILHHDALRFRYRQHDNGWQQEYGPAVDMFALIDLSAVGENFPQYAAQKELEFQQNLDIEKGELIKMVLFKTPAGESYNRLLIVCHHLAIDGVSWRILLEDIEILLAGGSLDLKTSAYSEWYNTLEMYGQNSRLLSHKQYWAKVHLSHCALPVDHTYEDALTWADLYTEFISLNSTLTAKLLKEVPRVYHTEISDLLLCALARTLCTWTGSDRIVVGLEGHGREHSIADEIDITRTVGWFTSLYPVMLKADSATPVGDSLKEIKESLRAVPDKGLGFGILKYILDEPALAGSVPWEVVFNYLGQVDQVFSQGNFLKPVKHIGSNNIPNSYKIDEKISITGIIHNGELTITWNYSKKHFKKGTITKLAEFYRQNLIAVIEHCVIQGQTGEIFTPSDFGMLGAMTNAELDSLLNENVAGARRSTQVENITVLSGLQEGMLFHSLYDRNTKAYTNHFACDLSNLDVDAFVKSWNHILKCHTVLRTGFHFEHSKLPVQCVYKQAEMPVTIIDNRHLNELQQQTFIAEYEKNDSAAAFDFAKPPLMRIGLIRLRDHDYRMIWTFHHIILDGWSLPIIMKEFLEAYERITSGRELVEAEIDQFGKYIEYIRSQDQEQQQSYWRNYLKQTDANSALLPFIRATSEERNKGIGHYRMERLHIDVATTLKLESFAQKNRLTLNTIMQGIWACLLSRYTGNQHATYGVTVSGRPEELSGIENSVGMYINTLPFSSTCENSQAFVTWLQTIQQRESESRQYQYTSLADLQKWMGSEVVTFDSLMVFENYPVSKIISEKNWKLKVANIQVYDQTNYPLTLLIKAAESVNITFSYNSAILEEYYVNMIKDHFRHVLTQIIECETITLAEIEYLTNYEKEQLLTEFNNTSVSYDSLTTIELFHSQVGKTPDAIAVVFDEQKLTYIQLHERSNQVARYLKRKGVKDGMAVPICLDRGIDMIVGLIGILKAGAAYVPIDCAYPDERIKYMIDDTQALFVVTNHTAIGQLKKNISATLIDLSNEYADIAREPVATIEGPQSRNPLTYIIYTSGTTGRPKGIRMPDKALVNLLHWHNDQRVKYDSDNRVLQFASINFDASFQEIFSALCYGGAVYLIDEARRRDMGLMLASIIDNSLNYLFMPYVVLKNLCAHAREFSLFPKSLTAIFTAGEQLRLSDDIREFEEKTGAKILNYYGPSETHVVTAYEVNTSDYESKPLPPIGKPIANCSILILDKDLQLCSVGTYGEIYIGGAQVAHGYLNNDLLTQNKFIANPYSTNAQERIYKSGDIGKWLPDGNIEFLGRNDDQVKIRGYRIELGEIEAILQKNELVKQVVVLARPAKSELMRLVAYIVPEGKFDRDKIQAYLRNCLPEYMVPSIVMEIEKIPFTLNGKVDKRLLPLPDQSDFVTNAFAEPTNEIERRLVVIWKDVLGVEKVGIHDNFFELGGQSLLAMRIVSAISREFKLAFSIKTFFQLLTIEQLARYVIVSKSNILPTSEDYNVFKL